MEAKKQGKAQLENRIRWLQQQAGMARYNDRDKIYAEYQKRVIPLLGCDFKSLKIRRPSGSERGWH